MGFGLLLAALAPRPPAGQFLQVLRSGGAGTHLAASILVVALGCDSRADRPVFRLLASLSSKAGGSTDAGSGPHRPLPCPGFPQGLVMGAYGSGRTLLVLLSHLTSGGWIAIGCVPAATVSI